MSELLLPWDRLPHGPAAISDRLLAKGVRPLGLYMPALGMLNGVVGGLRGQPVASAGLAPQVDDAGVGWALGGGGYIELAPLQEYLPRTDVKTNSFTIIAIVSATAAASFPMILSAGGGGAIELRLNGGSGQPQILVTTTGGSPTATLAGSIVGVGPVALVATFQGSDNTAASPSRVGVWCRGQSATQALGDGLINWSTGNAAARIGVRAGGTSFPFSGRVHMLQLLEGAIADELSAEIASSWQAAVSVCFAERPVVYALDAVSGVQLVGAAATQAAATGTGAAAQVQSLSGAPSAQAGASTVAAATQVHALAAASATQPATTATGAIASAGDLAAAAGAQPATAAIAAITQAHALAAAPAAQPGASATGSIASAGDLQAAATAQPASAATGTINQVHQSAAAAAAQPATSASGAATQLHTLVGAATAQPATSTTGAAGAAGDLLGTGAAQAASSATGAATQQHALAAGTAAQPAAAATGAATQLHALAGANTTQPATAAAGSVTSGTVHDLTAAASTQPASAGASAVQQLHVLVAAASVQDSIAAASPIVQAQMLAGAGAAQRAVLASGAITLGELLPALRPGRRIVRAGPRARTVTQIPEPGMKPTTLDVIDTEEQDVVTFDYRRMLSPGETLLPGVAVSCDTHRGEDEDAADLVLGTPQVEPTRVLQQVRGGLPGVTYHLRCVAPTSEDRVLTMPALLPCKRL